MSNETESLYEIRDFTQGDRAFVMATFLRGLYYGDSWFSLMVKDSFMSNYKHIAEALINKHMVKVACLKEDKDVILGYSILSKDFKTLHFIFVKSAFRKQGIGRTLTPSSISTVTHLTTLGRSLMSKIVNCKFDPFQI